MPKKPWSTNPNAPQIPRGPYLIEKGNFIGMFLGNILNGIVVVLFFKCMVALLHPANRTKGTKWGLIIHTVALFLCVMIGNGSSLNLQSISYIDNRAFPGNSDLIQGPFAYQILIQPSAANLVPFSTFYIGQWLADGLLLYRCCVIYAMNYWVITFPCLMYLSTIALSIVGIYYEAQPLTVEAKGVDNFDFGTPYYTITFSLNVILTLLILTRLILHRRRVRKSMGAHAGTTGLYNSLITMIIESYALYVVNYLIFIGMWGTKNTAQIIPNSILPDTQAIAPFLIILRVANRTAVTSKDVTSGNVGSMHFNNQGESTDYDESSPGESPVDSDTDTRVSVPGGLGIAVGNSTEEALH